MMDYAARYGLEINPFLKNAKDILLDTAEASEARVRLTSDWGMSAISRHYETPDVVCYCYVSASEHGVLQDIDK